MSIDSEFKYDVFLSHSSKDKDIVHDIARRLKADGMRVWLDEWEIKPGDSIPVKIREGLKHSRILALCMSAHAFSSDWTTLEVDTFRFDDPLNRGRRFIPIRLDNALIAGPLKQFRYINCGPSHDEKGYAQLLEAIRDSENVECEDGPEVNDTEPRGKKTEIRMWFVSLSIFILLAFSSYVASIFMTGGATENTPDPIVTVSCDTVLSLLRSQGISERLPATDSSADRNIVAKFENQTGFDLELGFFDCSSCFPNEISTENPILGTPERPTVDLAVGEFVELGEWDQYRTGWLALYVKFQDRLSKHQRLEVVDVVNIFEAASPRFVLEPSIGSDSSQFAVSLK